MMPLPSRASNQKWPDRRLRRRLLVPSWSLGTRNYIARGGRRATDGPDSIQKGMRTLVLILICPALVSLSGHPQLGAQEKPESAREYQREELGVNPYTAPSVADIFQQLDDLKPLPFEQLK